MVHKGVEYEIAMIEPGSGSTVLAR